MRTLVLLTGAAAAAALLAVSGSASAGPVCPPRYLDERPVYVGDRVVTVCMPYTYPPCGPAGCDPTAAPES